jgi:predicted XRE-type DNA-binding protein
MKETDELKMVESSGNVFKDLGYPNFDEHLLKARFAVVINDIIKEKDYTQIEAARILGIDQPKVSRLLRGILSGFSIDKLIMFLISLNQDIEVNIKPHLNKRNKNFDAHFSLHYTTSAGG